MPLQKIRLSLSVEIEMNDCICNLLTVQSFPAAASRIALFVKREAILLISLMTRHQSERHEVTDFRMETKRKISSNSRVLGRLSR